MKYLEAKALTDAARRRESDEARSWKRWQKYAAVAGVVAAAAAVLDLWLR